MTQNSQMDKSTSAALAGAKVKSAQSSLDSFAIIFEDGRGLLINAVADQGECGISVKILDGREIAPPNEAVCAVDWGWICGQSLVEGGVKESSGINGAVVKLTLTGVGTITVAAGMWQGKPFLSFMPYKPSK
jgi:hypothetical protein